MHFNSNLICSVLIAANAVIAAPVAAPKAKPAPTPEPAAPVLNALRPAVIAGGKFLWNNKGAILDGAASGLTVVQALSNGDDDKDDENHQAPQPPTVGDIQGEPFDHQGSIEYPAEQPAEFLVDHPAESPVEHPAEPPALDFEEFPVEHPAEPPALDLGEFSAEHPEESKVAHPEEVFDLAEFAAEHAADLLSAPEEKL